MKPNCEQSTQTEHCPSTPTGSSESSTDPSAAPNDLLETFERLELHLKRIHAALDAQAREQRYQDVSYARLVGGVLQTFAAGFLVLALLDWILHGVVNTLIVKLAFTGVFQLAALTAFVTSRRKP